MPTSLTAEFEAWAPLDYPRIDITTTWKEYNEMIRKQDQREAERILAEADVDKFDQWTEKVYTKEEVQMILEEEAEVMGVTPDQYQKMLESAPEFEDDEEVKEMFREYERACEERQHDEFDEWFGYEEPDNPIEQALGREQACAA